MDRGNQKLKLEYKNKYKDKNNNSNKDEKIDKKNIMDYFIIGEDENNDSISDISKQLEKSEEKNEDDNNDNNIKLSYKVSSFISSNYRPDLYSPLGIIGGNKYNLRKNSMKGKEKVDNEELEAEDKEEDKEIEEKEEEEEEEKESKIMDEKLDNVKKELDKYKLLKLGRYYVLDNDITVKCHNCGEIGHIKDYCPYTNLKFCHRCLSHDHNDKDCKNKKCFRCNKSGHNKNECSIKESEILICFNCQNSGHRKNECLINPSNIDSRFIKNNGLSCFYCGSSNHMICPLSERENIELKKENIDFDEIEEDMISSHSQEISSDTPVEEEEIETKKKSKSKKKHPEEIIENIKNEDIKFTIFCSYCGETHRNEECPLKDDPKFSNEFDTFRKNICKKILERRNKENEEDQKFNNLFKKRKRDNSNNNRNDKMKNKKNNSNNNNNSKKKKK
jgi:hypothetical protein